MSYLEELLPEFRNGAKIRRKYWGDNDFVAYSKETKNIRLIDAKSPMSNKFKYLGKSKANIDDLFEVE